MKLNPNTPEKYQHVDSRKVLAITELKMPIGMAKPQKTHIIHFKDEWKTWDESNTFIIEVPEERWQGILIQKSGIHDYSKVFSSIDELQSKTYISPYNYAINLATLEVVKL